MSFVKESYLKIIFRRNGCSMFVSRRSSTNNSNTIPIPKADVCFVLFN